VEPISKELIKSIQQKEIDEVSNISKKPFYDYFLQKEKNADAQCLLGDMYLEGMGVTENYAEAIRLWKLAAEQGDEEAQYNVNNYA